MKHSRTSPYHLVLCAPWLVAWGCFTLSLFIFVSLTCFFSVVGEQILSRSACQRSTSGGTYVYTRDFVFLSPAQGNASPRCRDLRGQRLECTYFAIQTCFFLMSRVTLTFPRTHLPVSCSPYVSALGPRTLISSKEKQESLTQGSLNNIFPLSGC